MSAELSIFKIEFDEQFFRSHGYKITLTQIGNTIYYSDFLEAIIEASRQKYWHLESECGFMGELLGKDIKALIEYKKLADKEPKNAELINNNLIDDDYYRVNISY